MPLARGFALPLAYNRRNAKRGGAKGVHEEKSKQRACLALAGIAIDPPRQCLIFRRVLLVFRQELGVRHQTNTRAGRVIKRKLVTGAPPENRQRQSDKRKTYPRKNAPLCARGNHFDRTLLVPARDHAFAIARHLAIFY